jgi:hypothetical protein
VISPDGHIEAMRPHQRIPCSKGEEGCVVSSGLGVGVGGEDQLLGQVGGGSPRLCEMEGELSVEVWRW